MITSPVGGPLAWAMYLEFPPYGMRIAHPWSMRASMLSPAPWRSEGALLPHPHGDKVRNEDQPYTLYMGNIPCMEGQGRLLEKRVVGWGDVRRSASCALLGGGS